MINIYNIDGFRRKGAPATAQEIKKLEEYCGYHLPKEYVQFLDIANGVAGSRVQLYSTEELPEINETYEVKEFSPGFLAIGDDGGGRAIMIKIEDDICPIYVVDHGSMMPEDMELLACSLTEWFEKKCQIVSAH